MKHHAGRQRFDMSLFDGRSAPMKHVPLVVPFAEVGRGDIPVAGGKGANLGELTRAGFPVPPGFVVTTAAYDLFVQSNGLDGNIGRVSEETAGRLRELFRSGLLTDEIRSEVKRAYTELDRGKVAVRSSATAEDLPEAAFAGQHDTFLNIEGEEALYDAVRRCWASLFTDRALAYRRRHNIDDSKIKLAVVVQVMVPSDAAGVLFTANPLTGERGEMTIDVSRGLGEAVVSGSVTPEHLVARKKWWGWSVAPDVGGKKGLEYGLDKKIVKRLVRHAARIERLFGSPQDIEWAWSAGNVFIIQARPITALPAPPANPGRTERFFAGIVAEVLSVRPYPLDATSWLPCVFHHIRSFFAPFGLALTPFSQLFAEEDGIIIGLTGRKPIRPTFWVWLAPLRIALAAIRYDPAKYQADPLLKQVLESARALESRDLAVLDWEDLLGGLEQAEMILALSAGRLRQRYMPRAALAAGTLWIVLRIMRREDLLLPLLTGLPNKTIEANDALKKLAARIRSDRGLSSAFAAFSGGELLRELKQTDSGRRFFAEFQAFLDAYGHREGSLSTVFIPTWKDSPEMVLAMIKGHASGDARGTSGTPDWQRAQEQILSRWPWRRGPLRSALLGLLGNARQVLRVREDTHFYATLAFPALRRTFIEAGKRLVSVGVLNAPEDVFHLKLGEITFPGGSWPPPPAEVAGLGLSVERRKARRKSLEGKALIDPRLYRRESGMDAVVRGTPASPGVAGGVARIIRGPDEFDRLQHGDVLVAPFTNPSWTPLFQRAVAVVVDTGGMASHAAIVAREYGIPAVMGAVEATSKLVEGKSYEVDGSRGIVVDAGPRH